MLTLLRTPWWLCLHQVSPPGEDWWKEFTSFNQVSLPAEQTWKTVECLILQKDDRRCGRAGSQHLKHLRAHGGKRRSPLLLTYSSCWNLVSGGCRLWPCWTWRNDLWIPGTLDKHTIVLLLQFSFENVFELNIIFLNTYYDLKQCNCAWFHTIGTFFNQILN